jgi:hypothetical protein
MRVKLLFIIFISLPIFTFQHHAYAKCPFAKYTITGTIQDNSTGQAIPNATLFFFFDDYTGTTAEFFKAKYPDFFTTNKEGVFIATAFFDTYSCCSPLIYVKRNQKLTVIITAPDYLAKRVILRKRSKAKDEAQEWNIELQPFTCIKATGIKKYTTIALTQTEQKPRVWLC